MKNDMFHGKFLRCLEMQDLLSVSNLHTEGVKKDKID